MHSIKDVQEDYRYVWEFKDEHNYHTFKRDKASCDALSKTMGVDFKAVYREAGAIERNHNTWEDGKVNWDCETIYAINPKGKLIKFTNSEWGSVGRVK